MLGIEFQAMGCHIQALACTNDDNDKKSRQALSVTPNHFAQAEQIFSRFITDSELMTLNAHCHMSVSPPLWDMLEHGLAAALLTQGLITPTVYQMLIKRGYTQSFDSGFDTVEYHLVKSFSPLENENLSNTCDWQAIVMDSTNYSVTLPTHIKLDLGGFAKMLTAYAQAQRLAKTGASVLINAGGDIVALPNVYLSKDKPKQDITNWQVDLPPAQDIDFPLTDLPKQTLSKNNNLPQGWQVIASDILQAVSIDLAMDNAWLLATSGVDYRHWYQDGKVQHHLVNPLNPTQVSTSEIVCASVLINPNQLAQQPLSQAVNEFLAHSNACNLAQTLGKVCCLLGVQDSLTWLAKHGLTDIGLSWIVATPHGFKQWLNPSIQRYLRLTNNNKLS